MGLPKKAIVAIQEGITQNATVAELEYLGVSLRTINQIEEYCGIIYLKDLLKLTDKEILNIPNLGEKGLASIKQALSDYDQLESSKKRWHNSGSLRLEHYKKNSKRLEGVLS
jgi:DNA-directed RNA polymerase alpha subunit